jgi:hypothetical protein
MGCVLLGAVGFYLRYHRSTATVRLCAADAPIGDIIGPDFYFWDMSLRKSFALPFREGASLQFQADAFNIFNGANWNNPKVNNAGAGSFGKITTSLPDRVLHFGGKISF